MGCCCSLFKKKNNKLQDDETTPLLSCNSDEEINRRNRDYGALEQFANKLINVEFDEISPNEYKRRSEIYEMRLSKLKFEAPPPMYLLNDIPDPEIILASEAISIEDEKMIKDLLDNAHRALKDFTIKVGEDIIVPFPP